jgi:hypothetical protein
VFSSNLCMPKRLLGTFVLACAIISGGSTRALAQENQELQLNYHRPSLVGSWLVTYDVPAFVVPIPILLSFTGDGIIIETDSPAPTPFGGSIGTLLLSNGHGSWKSRGKNEFSYTYRKILYDANGNSFGLVRTNGAVTLNKEGAQIEVNLDIRFTDNNGNVVLSATGTAMGRRIEVEDQ